MTEPLTPLERALVELVASENWSGFRTDGLRVKKRENTGVGRYTYLEDQYKQRLPDGTYGAQGKLLEMEGIKNGLAFVVDVSGNSINYEEIATYGDESWDGVERPWRIV
ncbi:MAG TPA: hypothetical protein VK582_23325 [Pyrinomonadaceae bacterium]|nr:hypothetical protein [Pyrinomonadaceae bacterium]